jgi:serine-type D-Ala-D-Ala carboxypeptidase/endopeptidase (penicillin-binding protein 4)
VLRLPATARGLLVAVLVLGVLVAGGVAAPPADAAPTWRRDIDEAIGNRDMSVAVALNGTWLYRHGAWKRMTPASNEKLLLSMALLHRTSLGTRLRTELFRKGAVVNGVLRGNLWIVGHGDPEVGGPTMAALVRAVRDKGIRRIRGRVMGATTGFVRDWWATGWRDYFPADYIPLPTALAFQGNEDGRGVHIRDPERRAARSLTRRLRGAGVAVTRDAGAGVPPTLSRRVATLRSDPFSVLLRRMNRRSRNFYAETLGKWLGGLVTSSAGSIAKGAAAIEAFARARGVTVTAYDASGLSYANRIRPQDLVGLLRWAETRRWGPTFRGGLPTGGQGTLEERLVGVRVRAKTGTLTDISTLSGWVWLSKENAWAEFSIMSRGMDKSVAVSIEDRIVRIVANRAAVASSARFLPGAERSMLLVS